jgi:hypothetical protein
LTKKEHNKALLNARDSAVRSIMIKLIHNPDFFKDIKKIKFPLEICGLLKWKAWWFLSFHFNGVYAMMFINLAAKIDPQTIGVAKYFELVQETFDDTAEGNEDPPGKIDNNKETGDSTG